MKLFFTKKKIENTDYYKTGKLGKIIFIKFLFKFYVKSFYQPFLTFILPSFLFLILTTITFWQIALPGMFAMAIMVIGINSTPFILTELKSSIVLKRMGVSPFKKKDIIGSIIIFVTFQIILAVIWLIFFGWVYVTLMGKLSINEHFFARMFVNRKNEFKNNMYFLIFIYGIALNALLSITIGMFISTFSKTSAQVGAYGLIIIIPSLFLSGQFLPVAYLAKYNSLYYPSLITPYRYITLIITSAFNGGEVMYGPTVFNFSLDPGAKTIRFRPPNLDMQWLYETITYRLSGSNGKVADYDEIKKEFASIMKIIGNFDSENKQKDWERHNVLEVIRNFINSSTKSSEINSLIEKLIKLNILDQETTKDLIQNINKGNLFKYLLDVLLGPNEYGVQPIEWFVGLDCYQNWELLFCHFYPISLSALLMVLLFKKFEFSSR